MKYANPLLVLTTVHVATISIIMLTSKVYDGVLLWFCSITVPAQNQGAIEIFSDIDCRS